MFLKIFFSTIALLFLFLFIIRLLGPKVFPYLKKVLDVIWDFMISAGLLFIKSSLYTIILVFRRTVYVIGLDIIIGLLINLAIVIFVVPTKPGLWLTLFYHNLLDTYVFSFFIFTYLIGLFEYLKSKDLRNFKITDFIKSFQVKKEKGKYIYDEEHNKYVYHEDK